MNRLQENRTIALNWIAAFNEHDLEGLLDLYSPVAEHFSPKLKQRLPETGGYIKGRQAMHSWWKDAFDRLPSLNYKLENLIIEEGQLLMEYLRQVEGEDDIKVAEILEIKDGKIVRSRVYHG